MVPDPHVLDMEFRTYLGSMPKETAKTSAVG
jgi:hypothetical protein